MAQDKKIDEDLYSRQLGAYGHEMMGKLVQMNVLIIGQTGLGVETAKNLILAGPHSVTVVDNHSAELKDLGSNFYLTEADVGKPRSAATVPRLSKLNPYVRVKAHEGEVTEELISAHHVVVVTDTVYKRSQLVQWSQWARAQKQPAVFIASGNLGAYTYMFSDFGANHVCFDADGEPTKTLIVDHISKANPGVVTIDGERHLLGSDVEIKFDEVVGMEELNGKTFKIKPTKNPKKFEIGDTSEFGEYKTGGMIYEQKTRKTYTYKTFEEQLANPTFEFGYMDFTKFGRAEQLHLTLLGVWEFQEQNDRLPSLHSEEDAAAVQKLAEGIAAKQKESGDFTGEVPADVVSKVALYAGAELPAFAALFGGVVAQEITKQTGKYTPLNQWLHFDAFEILHDKVPAGLEAAKGKTRYENQVAVFGQEFQDKLGKLNVFLVGAGALGCEYAKAFAMLGLGIKSQGGHVIVTDMDRIEVSNLNRQFLFRQEHVGRPKSVCVAEVAQTMNSDLDLVAHEIRVEPSTENSFDDSFWQGLDLVVNALDNIEARNYVDGKCVLNGKPLLESGTLGTQANSVVVVPHKTPSYSEGPKASEQGVPMCTLRNFPHLIDHCIEWARFRFDEVFVTPGQDFNSFLEDRDEFYRSVAEEGITTQRQKLESVKRWSALTVKPTFETCTKLVLEEFIGQFRDNILNLTHQFPADSRKVQGDIDLGPFWHGHKRFPQAPTLDANDELHVQYVFAAANILADILGVPEEKDIGKVKETLAAYKAPEWEYKKLEVNLDEDEEKKDGEESSKKKVVAAPEDEDVVEQLKQELSSADISGLKAVKPADFEKDDDTNHHIDFITYCSNLRAYNYHIKPATRHKCKMIAGKIIPAIATTTATITGFIQLELYKYVKGVEIEEHRGATINLGTNTFVMEMPPDPIKTESVEMDPVMFMPVKAVPEGFTTWDFVEIDQGELTVREFLAAVTKQHHGVVLSLLFKSGITEKEIAAGQGKPLYDADPIGEEAAARYAKAIDQPLLEVYEDIYGKVAESKNYIILECDCVDADDDSAVVPKLKYTFKH